MALEKNRALTKKQLETLKNKLLAEKQALVYKESLAAEDISLELPNEGDEVEASISDYNNSHLLRFRNREVFYVKKIDNALKKFANNEYGLCDDCGYWIKFERLLARPTAEMCIICKEEAERDEYSNIVSKQSKSMGRVVDLTGMMA